MSVLSDLKEIRDSLEQIPQDNLSKMDGAWYNRAMTKLVKVIAKGEEHLDKQLYKRDTRFD